MKLLIDLDSLLYKSVYKVVDEFTARQKRYVLNPREYKMWYNSEVYNEGINRCENSLLEIQNHLQEFYPFVEFEPVLYITNCKNNFRNKINKEYKSNRKRNNYVWMLRNHYQINGAICSDTLEADDLIAIDAKKLKKEYYIIVTMDKDLKQIGGWYWNYYKKHDKDLLGNKIFDEYGNNVYIYKQKEPIFITEKEANKFFWEQMLTGDTSDNIKGIKGIGKVKAEKLLNSSINQFITVAKEYIKRNQKQEFKNNYKLLKLGQNEIS